MSPLEYELLYASLGIPTIALEPLSKVPHRQYYGQFVGFDKIATADPVEIRGRRASVPAANIGIPTGLVSGLLVIDGDTKHDTDPMRSLMEWSDTSGIEIPDNGPLVSTPSGGWHLYFRLSGPCGSPVGWLPSVDIRADGAQVAAPPSGVGTMKSWKSYVLLRGDFASIPVAPVELVADVNQNGGRYAHNGAHLGPHASGRTHDIDKLRAEGFRQGDRDPGFQSLSWTLTLRYYPHFDLIRQIAYDVWLHTDNPTNDPFPWIAVERKLDRARVALEPRLQKEAAWLDRFRSKA